MVMFTVLNGNHVVRMLLGQNLTVLDRLNGCVKMILMNFTVNGSGGFLMTVFGDIFIHDSGSNFLVDSGVMVTGLVPAKVNQPTCSRSGYTTRSSHGPRFNIVNKVINRFGCRRLLPNMSTGIRVVYLHEVTDGTLGFVHDDGRSVKLVG